MGEIITGINLLLDSAAMEWTVMQAHYRVLFEHAHETQGESQESVAKRGGLRQNKISNLLKIKKLGPQVETFVRAIEGLGMTASAFFLQIEEGAAGIRHEHDKSGLTGPTRPAITVAPVPNPTDVVEQPASVRPARLTAKDRAIAAAAAEILVMRMLAGGSTDQADRSGGKVHRARPKKAKPR